MHWSSKSALMLRFDGRGNFTINKGSEGSNGNYGTAGGSGSYSLGSDCTGVGKISIMIGSQIVARARFDFYVGGTRANQNIVDTYQNADTQQTGNIRLIWSNL